LEVIWKGFAIDSKKSGAIESAKFILEVLKQHRIDLDKQLKKLNEIAIAFRKMDELVSKTQMILDDLSVFLRKKCTSDK
jgi:D-arabinose 1-dehydrogenase-like Zn-dependent alcohol dehydrogenase